MEEAMEPKFIQEQRRKDELRAALRERALRNLRKKGLVYATKYPRRVYYQQPGKKPNTG
jgi:hypothetical protein